MRFRPDQILKFNELYPDKPLSPTIRMLLDTFLDGKNPTPHRMEEVKQLREKTARQLTMLDEELKQLENVEQQKIMAETLEKQRLQYIHDHPEVLEMFRQNAISTSGYQLLQRELKFGNKQQVVEWLNKHNEVECQ